MRVFTSHATSFALFLARIFMCHEVRVHGSYMIPRFAADVASEHLLVLEYRIRYFVAHGLIMDAFQVPLDPVQPRHDNATDWARESRALF